VQTRPFGATGVDVPMIGIGTWNMERDDPDQAIAAIRRALELGMTHVDTAELYGSGRVETLVGEALAGRRDGVFLASKVLPHNASYEGTLRACEASLRRLGTDHLDLYLLHWRGEHPLSETLRAFEALRAQGKIRWYGVSNFDDADLDEAAALVGADRLACDQVLYHLGDRTIEHRVAPWCARHRTALVGYSPFGSRGGFPKSRVLEAEARRLGATPRQLALAFLIRDGAFAIPKSSNPAHVDELAAVDRITLDAEAIAAIDAAFPLAPWRGLPSI
jgi:diketogulonate reductase-like aldo/keto reductase